MIRVLVLFTCFNRIEKTKKCLESLKENNNCLLNYIVLDDNSSDGTSEFLESQSNVTLLKGAGDSFYSGGMRIAISKAKSTDLEKYKYVMFINDDVSFFPGAIDKLIDYEDNSKEIVVGAVCDTNGVLSYGGKKKTCYFGPRLESVRVEDMNLYCDTACANCVLIPTEIFGKLPNIDPVYHHSIGDFDYFYVAKRRGYNIKSSNFYVGVCNDNPKECGWRDCTLSRMERLKKKESVKGLPAEEWFHYLKKNYGLVSAIIFSLTPYLKIVLKR